MHTKNILLTALILLSALFGPAIFSQAPCTNQDAYKTVGSWKQSADFLASADSSFPKAQYPAVLSKAQTVIDLLKQANPKPLGVQPKVYRSIEGNSYIPGGALQFGLQAMLLGYFCVPVTANNPETSGKILLGDETETWIYINFNGLGWLVNDRMSLGKDLPTADGKVMFYSPKKIGDIMGLSLLWPDIHTNRKEEAVIITTDDRSPYKPVTREQFLRAVERFSKKKLKEMRESLQKMDADSESKFAKIDSVTVLTAEQKAQMKSAMTKQMAQAHGTMPRFITLEEDKIARIEAIIAAMSPDEREAQAIVRDQGAQPEKLFVTEAQGGQRLVTIDRSLFDPALPRQSIQLIVVYWSWNDKNPAKNEFIRQFKQNFDFDALRQMLRK